MSKEKKDIINHPEHYTQGIETIDYIRSWNMDYVRGNIIKYVTRFPYKGTALQDLKKAKWYLEYLIKEVEKNDDIQ
jgi:aryl-phospho-beta-D-glucosidase BglC (GH1 family)|tara:strand:- start:226 stop:453 length:228 start_codon:yes stop_codon:yes gene_type:complete